LSADCAVRVEGVASAVARRARRLGPGARARQRRRRRDRGVGPCVPAPEGRRSRKRRLLVRPRGSTGGDRCARCGVGPHRHGAAPGLNVKLNRRKEVRRSSLSTFLYDPEVMTRLRTRKSIAVLCAVLVLVAAFAPAVPDLPVAVLNSLWLIVPAAAAIVVRREAMRCDEQPSALLSI